MIDLRLDDDHDLYYVNGLLAQVDGDDQKIQQLWIHLSIGLGEWAFDIEAGFDYRGSTNKRGQADTVLEGKVRRVCDHVLGEGATRAIDIDFDAATKLVTISVDTIYGQTEVTG